MSRKRTSGSNGHRKGDSFTEHFVPVVDKMIENGTPFHEIEDYIEATTLPDEHKSALWLLAWGAIRSPWQRREILVGADLQAN